MKVTLRDWFWLMFVLGVMLIGSTQQRDDYRYLQKVSHQEGAHRVELTYYNGEGRITKSVGDYAKEDYKYMRNP
jgi:hypothetical protein